MHRSIAPFLAFRQQPLWRSDDLNTLKQSEAQWDELRVTGKGNKRTPRRPVDGQNLTLVDAYAGICRYMQVQPFVKLSLTTVRDLPDELV